MKASDAIAKILKAEGISNLFCYPVTPMTEACARADIRPIVVRQERIGLHMADAVSRLSSGRDIGVFAMQHGPGTENAFGGVAQAYSESVPMLVLPTGYARNQRQVAPAFDSVRNFAHVSKLAESVPYAADIPNIFRRAFTALRSGRGGPVVIEVPRDVYNEDIPDDFAYTPARPVRYGPDPKDVEAAVKMLLAAKTPMIYAGQGVHYARAWTELKELAELLALPVMTSIPGKSALSETHPLSLGCGGRAVPKTVREFLSATDLIFGIGCSFTETNFGVGMPKGRAIIHATLDPMHLGKDVSCALGLVGDAQLILRVMIECAKQTVKSPRSSKEIAAKIAASKEAWHAEWKGKMSDQSSPLNPYRVMAELMKAVDVKNTIITHDAGLPRDQLTPFWCPTEPLTFLGWGKSTQLGYSLGLALGAKVAHPDKLCINYWGDAAIGFTGMDFETAVRERLPILSILCNNFSMATEIGVMNQSHDKYGTMNISGNYADLAKALGGYGERVEKPGDIAAAIKRGIDQTKAGKPALLEFITQKEVAFPK
jgi:acetolactate synthase I/II/III large subunit